MYGSYIAVKFDKYHSCCIENGNFTQLYLLKFYPCIFNATLMVFIPNFMLLLGPTIWVVYMHVYAYTVYEYGTVHTGITGDICFRLNLQ